MGKQRKIWEYSFISARANISTLTRLAFSLYSFETRKLPIVCSSDNFHNNKSLAFFESSMKPQKAYNKICCIYEELWLQHLSMRIRHNLTTLQKIAQFVFDNFLKKNKLKHPKTRRTALKSCKSQSYRPGGTLLGQT